MSGGKGRVMRNQPVGEDMSPRAIHDLNMDVRSIGRVATSRAAGSIELAYYRGFQGGYEQAMRDIQEGCLNKDNALRPSRLTEKGKA